jgi:hypothetical protein
MNKNQAYKCAQPKILRNIGCALSKFFNSKSFEFNLQLPNHYKNALRVYIKFVELFSTSNLTHSTTTFTFKKKSISFS